MIKDGFKSKLVALVLLLTLVATLGFSGCSQVGNEHPVNSSVLLEKMNSEYVPTRDKIVRVLYEIKENPQNLSISSLFTKGEGYKL